MSSSALRQLVPSGAGDGDRDLEERQMLQACGYGSCLAAKGFHNETSPTNIFALKVRGWLASPMAATQTMSIRILRTQRKSSR